MPEAQLVAELSSALKCPASTRMPIPRVSTLLSQITDSLGQGHTIASQILPFLEAALKAGVGDITNAHGGWGSHWK
jgi:hypothetical protein